MRVCNLTDGRDRYITKTMQRSSRIVWDILKTTVRRAERERRPYLYMSIFMHIAAYIPEYFFSLFLLSFDGCGYTTLTCCCSYMYICARRVVSVFGCDAVPSRGPFKAILSKEVDWASRWGIFSSVCVCRGIHKIHFPGVVASFRYKYI